MKTSLFLSTLALLAASPCVVAATAVSAPALPPAISAGGSGNPAPATPEAPAPKADPMKLARTLLEATKAQTALLQTALDKASADAAAPGLVEASERIAEVTRQLATVDFTNTEIEETYMDLMQEMFSASEDVNRQFLRLEKAEWFGSEALKQAVDVANKPIFSSDEPAGADADAARPLTPLQQEAEVKRMGELVAPDRELVAALRKVDSVATAIEAVPALQHYVARQQGLMPADEAVEGYFENPEAPAIQAAYKPVSDLLMQVRAELLRIVAVEGFTTSQFDPFNDAMDEVFAMLEQTHDFWFGDVFDENFQDAIYDVLNRKAGSSPTPPAPAPAPAS